MRLKAVLPRYMRNRHDQASLQVSIRGPYMAGRSVIAAAPAFAAPHLLGLTLGRGSQLVILRATRDVGANADVTRYSASPLAAATPNREPAALNRTWRYETARRPVQPSRATDPATPTLISF